MTVPSPSDDEEIAAIRERLAALDAERTALESRLAGLLTLRLERPIPEASPSSSAGTITGAASLAAKIALFRSLFRGREDVFPKRWSNPKSGKSGYSPACANEWMPRLCGKPKVRCGDCPNRHFLPVTDTVIAQHLHGEGADGRDVTLGVYPMLADETCWFLAADFDKKSWRDDVAAFLETCRLKNIPAAVERSRSGNGGHVWIFFAEPIPAGLARRLGAHILTETMERGPELGFDSYDRFFPNQDTMPAGGFGNLIALPLQRRPREAGNNVFLDKQFEAHPDQWQYLSGVRRMTLAAVTTLTNEASRQGRILGVRLPIDDEDEEPWLAPPSRHKPEAPVSGPLPETVDMVLGDPTAQPVPRLRSIVWSAWRHSRTPRSTAPRPCACPPSAFPASSAAPSCRHTMSPCPEDAAIRRKPCSPPWGTGFTLPVGIDGDRPAIQDVYNALARDEPRNAMIFDDVLKALEGGRSPVILTERKGHALLLAERLARFARNVIVLHGGMGVKARREQAEQIAAIADTEERVLIATGRYIGEGFDDARLDTLFLTMPISWRGTLAQYAGRLHRFHPGKRDVLIYDYVDEAVPVLARMSGKRIKGYDSLGYSVAR